MKILIFCVIILCALEAAAQINIVQLNTPITENFDSLSNSGADIPFLNNITLPGWYSTRGIYSAGNGSATGGTKYSFGTPAASTERALGSVATSGSGTIHYGLRLSNQTSSSIGALEIEYYGEQWRKANNGAAHTLSFSYRQAQEIASLTDGVFISVNELDFITPVFGSTTATSLNGNLEGNRSRLFATINVTIPPGEEIMLRWTDIFETGANHGLAIDDLSIIARAAPSSAVASIEGRIITAEGRGAGGAWVVLTGEGLEGARRAAANPFGYYRFTDLPSGRAYVLAVGSKQYLFAEPVRLVTLDKDVAGIDFVALPR